MCIRDRLSAPAFAQDGDTAQSSQDVAYQAVTNIDFNELNVEGTVVGPDIDIFIDRPKAKSFSFINLRTDFNDEMSHSVAEVQ